MSSITFAVRDDGAEEWVTVNVDKSRPFVIGYPMDDDPDGLAVFRGFVAKNGRPMVQFIIVRMEDWFRLADESQVSSQVDYYGKKNFSLTAAPDAQIQAFSELLYLNSDSGKESLECLGYPRVWELLRFLLGSESRERLFSPAYNDLLSDHLESQLPKYQTTWARRWIKFCFGIRTAGLVVNCMAVGLRGVVAGVVVPVALREWIRNWWYGG